MKHSLMQDLNIFPDKVLYKGKEYQLSVKWSNGLGIFYSSPYLDCFFVGDIDFKMLFACFTKEQFFYHLETDFIKIL